LDLTKNVSEKHQKEVAKAEESKLKSIKAWAETEEKKSFGMKGFFKFTWPRLWTGGWWRKMMVIINLLFMIGYKITGTLIPLLLKEVIDSMTCDENKHTKQAFANDKLDKMILQPNETCPSEQETYILILVYIGVKFSNDFINYFREYPYANMAAFAEISITDDVYDHV